MNEQASSVEQRYEETTAGTLGKWSRQDTTWMLGLFGTAIGAGTLFLPINAGLGGFWPLLVLAALAFPMTYYAHRGLTRFVLSGREGADITDVVNANLMLVKVQEDLLKIDVERAKTLAELAYLYLPSHINLSSTE